MWACIRTVCSHSNWWSPVVYRNIIKMKTRFLMGWELGDSGAWPWMYRALPPNKASPMFFLKEVFVHESLITHVMRWGCHIHFRRTPPPFTVEALTSNIFSKSNKTQNQHETRAWSFECSSLTNVYVQIFKLPNACRNVYNTKWYLVRVTKRLLCYVRTILRITTSGWAPVGSV